MVHELARHKKSRMTERVRIPVGKQEERWRGGRQGKDAERSRVGAVCQGLVWNFHIPLAFILSQKSNSEVIPRLCIT